MEIQLEPTIFKIKEAVFYVATTPDGTPLWQTSRARLKDACISMEKLTKMNWRYLSGKGCKVMKMWSRGADKTFISLGTCDQWGDEEDSYHVARTIEELSLT